MVMCMTMNGPVTVDRGHVQPVPAPRNATHFRLRKGGKNGEDCPYNSPAGISIPHHPISEFEKDLITGRFGHDAAFAVQFFRSTGPNQWQSLGSWRQFGILPGEAEVEEQAMVVAQPVNQSADMGSALMVLSTLKDIATKDTEVQVSAHRAYADASIQAAREANQANLMIMGKMFETVVGISRPPPTTDPTLALVLQKIVEGQDKLAKLLTEDGDEEEEEPEENDVTRYLELVKNVKKHGMSALWDFAKDQGAYALVRALPTLEAKLPDFVHMAKPMVENLFKQMTAAGAGPTGGQMQAPPPQYAPPPPREYIQAAPRPAYVPPQESANGAAVDPAPVYDAESPVVS
jgi:hypothetical protein